MPRVILAGERAFGGFDGDSGNHQRVMTGLRTGSSLIYYDYQRLHDKFQSVPIDYFLNRAESEVICLRLNTTEWFLPPRIGTPFLATQMAQDNTSEPSTSFLVCYAKRADNPLILEVTRNIRGLFLTFEEFFNQVVLPLDVATKLIIAKDEDLNSLSIEQPIFEQQSHYEFDNEDIWLSSDTEAEDDYITSLSSVATVGTEPISESFVLNYNSENLINLNTTDEEDNNEIREVDRMFGSSFNPEPVETRETSPEIIVVPNSSTNLEPQFASSDDDETYRPASPDSIELFPERVNYVSSDSDNAQTYSRPWISRWQARARAREETSNRRTSYSRSRMEMNRSRWEIDRLDWEMNRSRLFQDRIQRQNEERERNQRHSNTNPFRESFHRTTTSNQPPHHNASILRSATTTSTNPTQNPLETSSHAHHSQSSWYLNNQAFADSSGDEGIASYSPRITEPSNAPPAHVRRLVNRFFTTDRPSDRPEHIDFLSRQAFLALNAEVELEQLEEYFAARDTRPLEGELLRIDKQVVIPYDGSQCIVCLEDHPAKPVACVFCRKCVGCFECIKSWCIHRRGETNRGSCPLCRYHWGLKPTVAQMSVSDLLLNS
ncbi:hypothetical protein M3Y98_00987100 [Aphelenchoides besseyi]|nr:hypothetical protein M3Y98_00987100 [Aphelenchoides besseyi]KAI6194849.1 hypothetical protein M3Y96_01168900 [Aphelenchoides besseyi]